MKGLFGSDLILQQWQLRGFQTCIFSTLHSTQDSYWLHKDGDHFQWGIFLKCCSQFFKTKPPKPKAKQTKELAPIRIFKPVVQRQINVTNNCSKAAGSIAFNSPLSPMTERTTPLYHLNE